MKNKDTIFALSTPPGKGALAILRVSGSSAFKIISSISTNMPTNSHKARYNKLLDKDKKTIDETITTFFKSPKSYTGEDVVEIITHGGGAIIKKIITTFRDIKGLRLAHPGEFTRRAFENNKLDLTQAEAVSDLVNAETEAQRQQAVSHLSGHFFKSTKKIFDSLKYSLANIEAAIDFSDEDLPNNIIKKTKEQIENNIKKIDKMLKNSALGVSIRSGFSVVLLGKTNTGKSTFMNKVSNKDVSIVTKLPGTTTDLIESTLDVYGYPISFVDTAGFRKKGGLIEKIGTKKALERSKESDLNLVFISKNEDIKDFSHIERAIFVKSKQDLKKQNFVGKKYYNISSKTGYGVKRLLKIIKNKVSKKAIPEEICISRERHIRCLNDAKKHLIESKKLKNADIFAEDIRLALKELSKLFGSVDIEDILDIIFNDFCIGK